MISAVKVKTKKINFLSPLEEKKRTSKDGESENPDPPSFFPMEKEPRRSRVKENDNPMHKGRCSLSDLCAPIFPARGGGLQPLREAELQFQSVGSFLPSSREGQERITACFLRTPRPDQILPSSHCRKHRQRGQTIHRHQW